MPTRAYGFLSDSLVEEANPMAEHLETLGYKVMVDHILDAAPSVPTFHAKRNKTELVVIVIAAVEIERLKNWCAYAKSTGRDFRVNCIIPSQTNLTPIELEFMRREGVGLFRRHNGEIIEEIAARDLGLNVGLPSLGTLSVPVRKHLGAAYEQFNKSQWREGFEDACQALENLSRKYLINEVQKGRVTQFIKASGAVSASVKKVKNMTLGQLAHAFGEIPNQNQTDAQLAQILKKINKDRVAVVHFKNRAATETRLRKNVGMHMWSIIAGIKLLR